jgi:hypothetical protein
MTPRIPIRIRQLPRYASNLVRRGMLWPVSPRQTAFRLCYFTCRSYFRYLYCSIHSLTQIETSATLEIIVFCDRNEMLTPEQVSALDALGPPVRVIPWAKAQGWGREQIAAIWEAYALAAADAPADAYVARVDSDVFFFSGWLFDLVAKSGVDLIGDGHYVDFEYCQGGLYFFRADAIGRVLGATPIADFDAMLERNGIGVEDKAAYFLARKAGVSIWLPFFMMFPDEYRNAGGLGAYQRLKYACLHYAKKDKAPMIDIYLDQVIPAPDRPGFVAVLQS